VTLAELLERREVILTELREDGGLTSISVDGTSVGMDAGRHKRELEIIDAEIAKLQRPRAFLSHGRIISPGCGS